MLSSRWLSLCAFLGLFIFQQQAFGAIFTMSSIDSAYGVDGGADGNYVLDGEFDYISTTQDWVSVRQIVSLDFTRRTEFRGAYEFETPDLFGDNVVINSASLMVYSTYYYHPYMYIYGYDGNGQVELSDFSETSNRIGVFSYPYYVNDQPQTTAIDVTDYFLTLDGSSQYLGILYDAAFDDIYLTMTTYSRIVVDYTVVPIAPAGYLFLSGAAGLLAVARRRKVVVN